MTRDFLIEEERLDPEVAGTGCIRMIAAATMLAWLDAVGKMGTYRDKGYRRFWRKRAQEWIQGEQYRSWMEYLDLDPELRPEELLEEYGAVVEELLDAE